MPASAEMLQVVAPLLLKMLHLKSININDVADVAPFPTSYINYAHHPLFSILHPRRLFGSLRKPTEAYGRPPGGEAETTGLQNFPILP